MDSHLEIEGYRVGMLLADKTRLTMGCSDGPLTDLAAPSHAPLEEEAKAPPLETEAEGLHEEHLSVSEDPWAAYDRALGELRQQELKALELRLGATSVQMDASEPSIARQPPDTPRSTTSTT